MKITAITKYKHGELHLALNKAGWNQSDLANRSGVSKETINRIYSLKGRPNRKTANLIQMALGQVGIYLDVLSEWPECFKGLKSNHYNVKTLEVPMDRLINCKEAFMISTEKPFNEKLAIILDESIETLTSKEKSVIRGYFYENKSFAEIGKSCGLTREAIRKVTEKAMNKLKHPTRLNKIKEVLDI